MRARSASARGLDVDSHLPQAVCVELLGQPEVLAGPRQHLGLEELVVGRHLRLEARVGALVAGELVLLKQLGDSVDVEAAVAHVLLNGGLHRAREARNREPLADTIARELQHGRVVRLDAGVALEARERRRAPLRRDLVVEQPADSKEDHLHCVEIRRLQAVGEVVRVNVVAGRFDQDLEVLPHRGIALSREALLEVRERALERRLEALLAPGLEVEDRGVEALDAELARALGREAREDTDQHLGVGVALVDPGGAGGGCRLGVDRGRCAHGQREQRETSGGTGMEPHGTSLGSRKESGIVPARGRDGL